jgi:hypothetical protein
VAARASQNDTAIAREAMGDVLSRIERCRLLAA